MQRRLGKRRRRETPRPQPSRITRLRLEPLEFRRLLALSSATSVVINEIHYDPDFSTDLVEFVEIYNAGTQSVNLGD